MNSIWTRTYGYAAERYVSGCGNYVILNRDNGSSEQNGWMALHIYNGGWAKRLAFHLITFDDAARVVNAHRSEAA